MKIDLSTERIDNKPISRAYNMDCMEFMRQCPNKFFAWGLPDPPYGIGEAGKNHKTRNTLIRQSDGVTMRRAPSNDYVRKDWDNEPPTPQYFQELFRVTQNQIIFGANYFTEIVGLPFNPPRRNQFSQFLKQNPTHWIIWDKCNGTNDFNDCELIWVSRKIESFILPYMWAGMMQGVSIEQGRTMRGNKSLNEKRIHPTQKPIPVYQFLLSRYCSGKILDTHLGSQSHRIASYKMGFDFWATELDEDYFRDGNTRFEKAIAMPLFDAPKQELKQLPLL